MSKTWRKDERRRAGRRCGREAGGAVDYTRRSESPERVTAEWAVGRMDEHILYELERLVDEGMIIVAEKEDYRSRIRRRIVKAFAAYEDEKCLLARGSRAGSPVHYFTVVVDNEIRKIRTFCERMCRNAVEMPIAFLPCEEASRYGYVSAEALGDRCRCVRDLEFAMDVNELRGMMKPLELEIFDLRLREMTQEEISDLLGISRYRMMRIMGQIRAKARKCGFVPPSEARKS